MLCVLGDLLFLTPDFVSICESNVGKTSKIG